MRQFSSEAYLLPGLRSSRISRRRSAWMVSPKSLARCARVFGLLASTGSDFHDPGESPLDLGSLPPLPLGLVPVWSRW
jgi:hypothetical protein